ncbi:MAG TPA: hypothetical protein VKY80_08175 [Croceibacterium sp.]|nr:hypothetical protein [Croceibacterium sp.]
MSKLMPAPGAATRAGAEPAPKVWMPAFLAALAETSNVARAAKRAGIAPSTAYDTRRRNREFLRKWREALCEGYDNLEMELLGRLREGEIKPATGAKKGVRTFDNAIAFRLLAVHRETIEGERARQANVSAAEVRASIEKKVAALRAQVIARSEAERAAADMAPGAQGDDA